MSISLQLLYQQNCSKWAVSVETWRVVTERERGWPERHLYMWRMSWPLPLLGHWLANKLTVLLRGCWNCLIPSLFWHPVNTKHLYDFMQCWTNVEDVGPTLYKCYTNVLCLLGRRTFFQTLYIYSMLVQCWASVADVCLALKQHWINVPFK